MTTITFDKLAYVDKLKSSGVSEEQARAQADALDSALRDTVATKQDIAELKLQIAEVKTDVMKVVIPLLVAQVAVFAAIVKLL